MLSKFSSTSLIFLSLSLVCSEDLREGEVESASVLSLCTFYWSCFSSRLTFLSSFLASASFSKSHFFLTLLLELRNAHHILEHFLLLFDGLEFLLPILDLRDIHLSELEFNAFEHRLLLIELNY